jgi:hypothetical protein
VPAQLLDDAEAENRPLDGVMQDVQSNETRVEVLVAR